MKGVNKMTKTKGRRLIAMLMAVMMVFTAMPMTALTANAVTTNEDGYIEVKTIEDLYNIRDDLTANYILMNDIDLTEALAEGGQLYNDGKGWDPIADFSGNFNGNGFEISGFYQNIVSSDVYTYAGLFKENRGEIKNLTIRGSINIRCTSLSTSLIGTYVGGVVGYNAGTISNCVNYVSIEIDMSIYSAHYNPRAGGIAGYSGKNTEINNCGNFANIHIYRSNTNYDGTAYVGGITGSISNNTAVSDCYNLGDITVSSYLYEADVGGVVGNVGWSTNIGGSVVPSRIQRCYNAGNITAGSSRTRIGGIAGYISACIINDTYNHGDISATSSGGYSGGIVGYISDMYAESVESNYNIGEVEGSGTIGGIVGINRGSTIQNCYYVTSNDSFSGIGLGDGDVLRCDNISIRDPMVLEGFDLETVWLICDYSPYPVLKNLPYHKNLKTISLNSLPKKLVYELGETLNTEGLELELLYSDGSKEITSLDYTTSGFSSATTGTKTVLVTYGEATTSFEVTVKEPTPESLLIIHGPSKTTYEIGEELDTTGLELELTYSNGSTENITEGFNISGFNSEMAGTKTVTVSCKGVETTYQVIIKELTLESISVKSFPNKIFYEINDDFDTEGLEIELTYSNGTSEIITEGFELAGFTSETAGTKTVMVTYGGKTTSFAIIVNELKVTVITLKTPPQKNIYEVGETLDTTGLELEVTYSNNSKELINTGYTTSGFSSATTGTKTVLVTYGEATTSFEVTVKEPTPESLLIIHGPSKTTYEIGEELDTTGLELELTYSNGSTENITEGFNISGFNSEMAGTKTVTVSCKGVETTYQVIIKELTLESISVKSFPNKIFYEINDDFDTEGLEIELTYSNGTSEIITEGFELAGFTSETAGTKTVMVTYGGKTTSFAIIVNELKVTVITLKTPPQKNIYEVGETLDTTGLELEVTYSNNSKELINTGYTTSGFSSATAGSKTVTVQYGGLTTSFVVTVNDALALEDSPQLIMGSSKTMAGKEVVVTLSVKNNPGIAGLAVSLKYDESVLTLKDTENGGLFSGFTAAKNFAWDESEDVTDDGVLATYTFIVAEDAQVGNYNIEVLIRSCTNGDLDDVELLTTTGIISVIDFVYGDSNGDQKIDIKDVVLLRKYITNFDYDTNTSSVNVDLGADANDDNKIDMKDVVILRKYITNYDYDTESSTVVLGPQ